MVWRTAHGTARAGGRLVVSETLPADELPPAAGSDPARVGRDAAGRFLPGNPWARLARAKAGPGGALAQLDARAAPEWRAVRRWAKRAAAHRIREFGELHGHELSAGVCMLLVDAADLRADARYLAARARADDNAELSRVAASLLASARQAERDAWELGAREAQARAARDQGPQPWFVHAAPPAQAPQGRDDDGGAPDDGDGCGAAPRGRHGAAIDHPDHGDGDAPP